MKTKSIKTVAMAASAVVAIGLTGRRRPSPTTSPPSPPPRSVSRPKLANGDVVQAWTVTGLKPSTDEIPYAPQGTLWGRPPATNEALLGLGPADRVEPQRPRRRRPDVPGAVRVATPQGVNPSALAEGQKTSARCTSTSPARRRIRWSTTRAARTCWSGNPLRRPPAARVVAGPRRRSVFPADRSGQSAPAATAPAPATGFRHAHHRGHPGHAGTRRR